MSPAVEPATIPVAPVHSVIRQATLEDVPQIVAMGSTFIVDTVYRDLIEGDPELMTGFVERLIRGERSVVFVAGSDTVSGILGLFLSRHPMSGKQIAVEAFWYVDPNARGSAGIRLLKAALRWATEHEAEVLQMGAPHQADRVAQVYQALGFVAVETTWQLRLTEARAR